MTEQLQVVDEQPTPVDEQPTENRVVKLDGETVDEIEEAILTVYERTRLYSGAETCHAIANGIDEHGVHPRVIEALVELEALLVEHRIMDGWYF